MRWLTSRPSRRRAAARPTRRPVRRLLLMLPVLLSVLLGLTAPRATAAPAVAVGPGATGVRTVAGGPRALVADGPAGSSTGAEVARLFTQASTAAERYEAGQRAARAQRIMAVRLEQRLIRKRAENTVLHGDVGRTARAQYRTGGQLTQLARLLLATSSEDLLRDQRIARQASRSMTRAVVAGRRAERKLVADEHRAARTWHTLDRRNTRLATLKAGIEDRLEAARDQLQGEAEESVAAGRCPPAVHLGQPAARTRQAAAAPTVAWVLPVDHYELSAGFDSAGAHWAHRHTGQDFAVDIGTPVRVVSAGRVVSVACGGPFGIQIVVRHPDGYYTQYAHLSARAVGRGDQVATGRQIAESGSTGNSTGPHLHFEVRTTAETGSAIDPVEWLTERGIKP